MFAELRLIPTYFRHDWVTLLKWKWLGFTSNQVVWLCLLSAIFTTRMSDFSLGYRLLYFYSLDFRISNNFDVNNSNGTHKLPHYAWLIIGRTKNKTGYMTCFSLISQGGVNWNKCLCTWQTKSLMTYRKPQISVNWQWLRRPYFKIKKIILFV